MISLRGMLSVLREFNRVGWQNGPLAVFRWERDGTVNEISVDFDKLSMTKFGSTFPNLPTWATWFSNIYKDVVVYSITHDHYCEDGHVGGLLRLLGIPNTHSEVWGEVGSTDKAIASAFVESLGLPTNVWFPAQALVDASGEIRDDENVLWNGLGDTVIVKPARLGGSVMTRTFEKEEFDQIVPFIRANREYGDRFVIQEVIKGKELTVPVVSLMDVQGNSGITTCGVFYLHGEQQILDEGNKKNVGGLEVTEVTEYHPELLEYARMITFAFDLEGFTRLDFMFDEENGRYYFLETNAIPGVLYNGYNMRNFRKRFATEEGKDDGFLNLVFHLLASAWNRHSYRASKKVWYMEYPDDPELKQFMQRISES
jgi:D-alanine-D-alanine ligase